MDVASSLGRQPAIELHTDAVGRMAPSAVRLDHARGRWQAEFWI